MAAITAKWYWKGNIKVGAIATFSTLPGNMDYVTDYGVVKGTCGDCAKHCGASVNGKRPPCYVFKSHRYPSVVKGQARNTLAFRQDPMKAGKDLSDALKRKRKPVAVCRFDQSGEIESIEWFKAMEFVAVNHEEKQIYIYTKKYDVVVPELLAGNVPENFTVNISIWHEQGIEAWQKVKHLPNVKAFVYCDKNTDPVNGWDVEEYAAHCIIIQTFCKAYGENGKMNHEVTCERCKKCFDRSEKHKVIGCNDH